MIPRATRGGWRRAVLALGCGLGLLASAAWAGESPPGVLWGRLAVEEESPDGSWTPLHDVEVTVYPATTALLDDLERIRRSARDSAAQHASAVARVQAALAEHRSRIEAAQGGVGTSAGAPRRKVTDPAGIFAFEALPAGEWLLVAQRVTAYGAGGGRSQGGRAPTARDRRFVPRAGEPPKEAEVWVAPVRVRSGERVFLLLTDRARWLVGPTR